MVMLGRQPGAQVAAHPVGPALGAARLPVLAVAIKTGAVPHPVLFVGGVALCFIGQKSANTRIALVRDSFRSCSRRMVFYSMP